MNTDLASTFSQDIKNFLKLQESLGFSPESYRSWLKQFDTFLYKRGFKLPSLTKKVILEWVEEKHQENNNGRRARLFALNKFLKYLCELGKCECTIPKECYCKVIPYSPYLFTNDELSRFFSACDSFYSNSGNREDAIVLPVVFRMIFCCALRPGEAFRLKRCDVDLIEGTIQIKQAKHHKDRMIWMSKELLELCCCYDKISIDNRLWFFSRTDGAPFGQGWLTCRFKKCIDLAKIGNVIHKPRIYDFRHSACSRVLLNWIEKGENVDNLVYCLKEHMGHSSFSHTLVYLHILPENILCSSGIDWRSLDDLYPSMPEEAKK